MPLTISKLHELLKTINIKFAPKSDHEVVLCFKTTTYQNLEGTKELIMVIFLDEQGEYFKLIAPYSFMATGSNYQVFLRALLMVQFHAKLIQFELNNEDDSVHVIIEFPVEDSIITGKQLARCIYGMLELVETYFPVLDKALTSGEIDLELRNHEERVLQLAAFLRTIPPDILAEALRRADERN